MPSNFHDFSTFFSDKGVRSMNQKNVNQYDFRFRERKTPIITYSGRPKRKFSLRRFLVILLLFFLLLMLFIFYMEKMLAPKFTELSCAAVENYILETVNESVGKMADEGLLSYSSMVKTVRDDAGQVVYLEVDTAMLGKAKSQIVKELDKALSEKRKVDITLPFGSLVGWNLTSGRGFPVKVKVFPVGMAEGEIYTVLEDCGINQTRHMIRVDVTAKMIIVMPGENMEVKTSVSLPLGERVLVGDVPEIYLDNIGGN